MKKKLLLGLVTVLLITGCKDVKLSNGENAIVTFNEGGISSDDLYKELKNTYGAEKLVDLVDNYLLNKLYEKNDEENSYVNQSVKSIKNAAKEAGADLNLYLTYYYGLSDEDALRNYLRLSYKRDKWISDYAKETVTEKQINEYYEGYVYGDVEASQILITIDAKSDDNEDAKKAAEEKALNTAKDIIAKLKKGEDFSTLAKEYSKDASTANNGGSLGKVNSDDVSSEVFDALISMKDNTYSLIPVKSSYGYHILFRKSQDAKPSLESVKDDVISKVAETNKKADGFSVKALTALREKYEMKIIDTDLEKAFNELNK